MHFRKIGGRNLIIELGGVTVGCHINWPFHLPSEILGLDVNERELL